MPIHLNSQKWNEGYSGSVTLKDEIWSLLMSHEDQALSFEEITEHVEEQNPDTLFLDDATTHQLPPELLQMLLRLRVMSSLEALEAVGRIKQKLIEEDGRQVIYCAVDPYDDSNVPWDYVVERLDSLENLVNELTVNADD